MGIKGKADERWPQFKQLSELGWTLNQIAEATGWSSATVYNDLRRQGGMTELFPDRPKGRQEAYAATFKFYLSIDREHELWSVVEDYLQIRQIRDMVSVMYKTHAAFCQSLTTPEDQIHFNLARNILGVPTTPPFIRHDQYFVEYCQNVREGQVEAPGSFNQAFEVILLSFSAQEEHRQQLHFPLYLGLTEVVEKMLIELDDDRLSWLMRLRFGLDGQPALTLEEVARELNLTRERIRQLEVRALHHLRKSEHIPKLAMFFMTIGASEERMLETERQHQEDRKRLLALRDGMLTTEMLGQVKVLDQEFIDCDLSVRTLNCLFYQNICQFGQIVQLNEATLLGIRNLGRRSLREIKELLEAYGLDLDMRLPVILTDRYPLPAHIQKRLHRTKKL